MRARIHSRAVAKRRSDPDHRRHRRARLRARAALGARRARGGDRLAQRRARRRGRAQALRARPRRRDRGARRTSRRRSRARSSSSPSPSAPSRRTSTTCARRSSPASCWSTARCRSPPRSAARRPARSASGRARPPSRRRRWSPTASPWSRALHTVSAPSLADTGADLDEDVLLCGDRKADKAKVARLIEEIAGPAGGQRRAAGDGADRRAADADADLDQRPLQDPRRDPDQRAARRRPLGSERCPRGSPCLAGGTGGAKLAAGLQDLIGDEPRGDRQHRPTTPRSTASTSAPTPTWSPTGSPTQIDEERGWGIRDDSFTVHERLEQLGAPGLVLALRPRPRDLPLPHPLPRRGRHADRRPGADRPRARRRAPGCCRCPSSRCAPGCAPPAGWRGAAGVPDPRPRRGADRGRRARRDRRRARRPPRCSRRSPSAEAVDHRPLEPGDLDRPDPRRARGCARRSPPRPGPVVAVSPLVARPRGQGPDRGLRRGARPPAHRRRGRLALRGAARRDRRRRRRPGPEPDGDRDAARARR